MGLRAEARERDREVVLASPKLTLSGGQYAFSSKWPRSRSRPGRGLRGLDGLERRASGGKRLIRFGRRTKASQPKGKLTSAPLWVIGRAGGEP